MTELHHGAQLMSMTDIAELAKVKRPVVSNWRRRYEDFPGPAVPSGTRPLFSGTDVVRWLITRNLGNVPADRLQEELAPHAIMAYAADFGARPLVEITSSLLCLSHLDRRPFPDSWADLLRRAERLDAEDEFVLRELKAAAPSVSRLAHLAEELIEAAYTPGGAYEWLLAARTRLGLTDLTTDMPASELLRLVTEVADLPSRMPFNDRITIADPHAGTGDFLSALIKQTDEPGDLVALAATQQEWLARLVRRRLLLAGVEDYSLDVQTGTDLEERMADPSIIVTQLPYRPGETRSALTTLLEVERVSLLLRPESGAIAIVIGPADALVDRLTGIREARLRSELLRRGVLETVVALPGGVTPYRPGHRPALWVMASDPAPKARGRVLLCDIVSEPLTEHVRARLVEDILLWRAEGLRLDGHDPRYGQAVTIDKLEADFGGPLTPTGPPVARMLGRTVAERPARISQAELRLEQAADKALEAYGQLRSGVVARTGRRPPLVTVGDLITDRSIRKVKGHRIAPQHIQRDGHHAVLGPHEITGPAPVGARRIDRLLFAATYEHASLTRPGDIVYTTTPSFALMIDHDGFNVALFPARVLRVNPNADRPLTSRVLVALLRAARNTIRSPSAVHAPRIEDFSIPELETEEVDHLDALLRELEERQRLLQDQQNELTEIYRLTAAGFADRTLTISRRATARQTDRRKRESDAAT
ncbi:hypothetical protein [Actinomadura sp. NTSP31]|uniref:hypothetical protein n=1 Tax=Actinomadura sp. NTSP31 TaxID=1735447 RepID=UPI0035C07B43